MNSIKYNNLCVNCPRFLLKYSLLRRIDKCLFVLQTDTLLMQKLIIIDFQLLRVNQNFLNANHRLITPI